MNFEILKLITQVIISVGAAFLAAWLAANRFKRDKIWEKKMASYSELIDSLHKMKFPVSEHYDAMIINDSVPVETSKKLWKDYRDGRRNVLRIAESSSFLLSPELMEVIKEMNSSLSKADGYNSWYEHLDELYCAIDNCLDKVKEIGRKELAIIH